MAISCKTKLSFVGSIVSYELSDDTVTSTDPNLVSNYSSACRSIIEFDDIEHIEEGSLPVRYRVQPSTTVTLDLSRYSTVTMFAMSVCTNNSNLTYIKAYSLAVSVNGGPGINSSAMHISGSDLNSISVTNNNSVDVYADILIAGVL
jgi:hypothetical protein